VNEALGNGRIRVNLTLQQAQIGWHIGLEDHVRPAGFSLLDVNLSRFNLHMKDFIVDVQLVGFIDLLRLLGSEKGLERQGV